MLTGKTEHMTHLAHRRPAIPDRKPSLADEDRMVPSDTAAIQPKRLTLTQCETLTKLMKDCKVSIENFCERYGIGGSAYHGN